ncbi:MAG: M20 family metallopeptidase [Desulfuromonas sp.]|nr:M20 family metallopeptidase [Desulfuromonas sp.]
MLVEINSYTANKQGVDAVRKQCESWLNPLGFYSHLFARQHIGDHLLLTTPRTDGDRILLLGHLDTVFPAGTFESYRQDDSWVYGPGVCDMKGGLIVAIEALEQVFRLNGALNNIDFLLVSDEETGSDDSKALTQQLAPDYQYCFVLEAAGKNMELVTARKGVGTFTMEIHGRKAHSGGAFHQGIDANCEAAHKLLSLCALCDVERGTTVNVGKISGGIGANTVSGEASLLFEIRYASNAEKVRLLTAIEKLMTTSVIHGTTLHLRGLIQRDVMEETQQQQWLLKRIRQISGQLLPTEHRGGVSDANLTAQMGIPTLDGFGPFGDGDHTLDERALITSFTSRIDLLVQVLNYQQQQRNLGMENDDGTDDRVVDVPELRRRQD